MLDGKIAVPLIYIPAKRLDGVTFVYVAKCEGHSKIGLSDFPSTRAEALQTGCPFKITIHYQRRFECRRDGKRAEAQLHRKFAEFRGVGEWFAVDPNEIAKALEELQL